MPLLCLWVCWWGLEVHHSYDVIWVACHHWRWMCGGHWVLPAWSLETSWTGWVRISVSDRHLLLSWRTPVADCCRGLPCWNSHIVPERLEPVTEVRTCHRPACPTLWNASLTSMTLWNRLCWCCRCFSRMTQALKICSTELWPGLNLLVLLPAVPWPGTWVGWG